MYHDLRERVTASEWDRLSGMICPSGSIFRAAITERWTQHYVNSLRLGPKTSPPSLPITGAGD
jgi:hypothetical protein